MVKGYICGSLHLCISIIINTFVSSNIKTFEASAKPPTTFSHFSLKTHTMAAIEQTWSLEGKVAVVTGSGMHLQKSKHQGTRL